MDLLMCFDSRNPAASRPTLQVQGGPAGFMEDLQMTLRIPLHDPPNGNGHAARLRFKYQPRSELVTLGRLAEIQATCRNTKHRNLLWKPSRNPIAARALSN